MTMRACRYLIIAVALALSSASLDSAVGKSREISYLSEVSQLMRIFNRIYLTKLFDLPTDTLIWPSKGSQPGAPRNSYCTDELDPSSVLEPRGPRYAIKSNLLPNNLVAWPF